MFVEERNLYKYLEYYQRLGNVISTPLKDLIPHFVIDGEPKRLQGKVSSDYVNETISFEVYFTNDIKVTDSVGVLIPNEDHLIIVLYQDPNLLRLYKPSYIEAVVIRELVRSVLYRVPEELRKLRGDWYHTHLAEKYDTEPWVLSYHPEDQVILSNEYKRTNSAFEQRMFLNAFMVALQKRGVNVREFEVDLEVARVIGKKRLIEDYMDYRPGISSDFIHKEMSNRILALSYKRENDKLPKLCDVQCEWK